MGFFLPVLKMTEEGECCLGYPQEHGAQDIFHMSLLCCVVQKVIPLRLYKLFCKAMFLKLWVGTHWVGHHLMSGGL